jgi:hypothetical protein
MHATTHMQANASYSFCHPGFVITKEPTAGLCLSAKSASTENALILSKAALANSYLSYADRQYMTDFSELEDWRHPSSKAPHATCNFPFLFVRSILGTHDHSDHKISATSLTDMLT